LYVSRLAVADWRLYTSADVAFDEGVSVLVGPNAQGKTNLVEAIGYLATLSSHRVPTDAPLVRAGATRAVVRAQVRRDQRDVTVEIDVTPGKANKAKVNGAPVPRSREVLGLLRTVLFAPEDLALVKGEPEVRRRFLDDLLVLRQPRWAGVRADFDRVLKQRNALLKTAVHARRAGQAADWRTLDVWDAHLAAAGAELLAGRLQLVDEIADPVLRAYSEVSAASGACFVTYKPCLELPEKERDPDVLAAVLANEIAARRSEEMERGISLVGPHRDDVDLALGDLPVKGYGSHGETWSVALALRLASWRLLVGEGAEGGDPVLMLDDVFAELDTGRRQRLAELVAPAEQVIITAAVAEDVPAVLAGARFDVMAGVVTRVV
jgi:DNA replication and repair protein RecF